MKTKVLLIAVLTISLAATLAFAAGTPAGTAITNYATGEYRDANGNSLPSVTSNTVTTIVSQVAGVDISPSTAVNNILLEHTVSYALTLTNTGNGTDTYDLTKVIVSGGAVNTAAIYYDANGNGVADAGESEVTATSELAADATYDLVIVVTNVSGADQSYSTETVTATSQFNASVSDASVLTTTVSASVLTVTMTADNLSPRPGDVVTFTIYGENNGTATSKHVVIVSPIATNLTYVPGSMKIMTVSRTDAADDDSSDFNVTNANSVTFTWGDAPQGASGSLTYQVIVNDDVPVGTIVTNSATVTFNNAAGTSQSPVTANATGATLTIAQIYGVLVGADISIIGDPGDIVYYPTTVTNTGNGPDIFNITYTSLLATWEFYYDHNADGEVNNGDVLLEDTNGDGKIDFGTMAQGEIVYVIGKTTIPPGTSDGAQGEMHMIATSVGDPTVYDEGVITITVTAPILSLTKTVSPTGNQPPGTTLTYTVTILNSGSGIATVVVITDAIPTNTTYVAGSMQLGGVTKTDVSDGDGGTHTGNSVLFEIPQIGPGGSTTTSFQATID
ncbi:MAG: DUF11 domain-containing protein [Candidatus Marinimicrobia bacterium]|jgi:uncharacterized repeat protein (TIGR01451 family)|nr:DUF11 domain-containing protein [Candidatus Neomarinimicrobiota bacterium]MCK9559064.1 DUF11 domain-containing protein [Candidatus Neomarinimicrobiota bacterium]